MKSRSPIHTLFLILGGCLTALVLSSGAYAQTHGGGGRVGGGGGQAHAGHGGGYGGGYQHRGGYGWHGGYGWRGYGWRGGWGCCGWGWGWAGLGLGLYVATLPLYYSTYWWDGIPYYYSNDTYYTWDPNVRQYVTVAPPSGLQAQGGSEPSAGNDIIAYPKNGQSTEQQGKDRFECHQWAASQTGFDPTLGAAAAAAANRRSDYLRAQAACLEGRGYSVQ